MHYLPKEEPAVEACGEVVRLRFNCPMSPVEQGRLRVSVPSEDFKRINKVQAPASCNLES